MAMAGADGKDDFPRRHADVDHENALASVQAGSRRALVSPPMEGEGAAQSAATMPFRVQADPIRELRCQSTG